MKTIRWTISFEDGTTAVMQGTFGADREDSRIKCAGNLAALRDANAGSLPRETDGLIFEGYDRCLLRGKFKSAEKEESGEWLVMKL